MKKLMIAAAIVCAAAFSQAATTTWQFVTDNPAYAGDSSTLAAGATAYLVGYSPDMPFGVSQATVLSILQNGGTMADDAIAPYLYTIASPTVDANGFINTTATFDADWKVDMTGEGDWYAPAYLVLVDEGKVYLGSEDWYAQNPLNESQSLFNPMTGETKYMIDTTGSAAYSSAGWYTTAVPEPTSGLLLLLGVAGLALRRRRA